MMRFSWPHLCQRRYVDAVGIPHVIDRVVRSTDGRECFLLMSTRPSEIAAKQQGIELYPRLLVSPEQFVAEWTPQ
jgi:hypothetical protein